MELSSSKLSFKTGLHASLRKTFGIQEFIKQIWSIWKLSFKAFLGIRGVFEKAFKIKYSKQAFLNPNALIQSFLVIHKIQKFVKHILLSLKAFIQSFVNFGFFFAESLTFSLTFMKF